MQMVGLEAARIIFSIFNCFFFFLTYLLTRTFRYCAFTMNYTTEEYVDMIYCYGMARGNARAAERFYAELYPNRNRHPSYHTIIQCYRRARRTGILQRKQYERPVQRCADLDDEILRAFEENPHNSTRRNESSSYLREIKFSVSTFVGVFSFFILVLIYGVFNV